MSMTTEGPCRRVSRPRKRSMGSSDERSSKHHKSVITKSDLDTNSTAGQLEQQDEWFSNSFINGKSNPRRSQRQSAGLSRSNSSAQKNDARKHSRLDVQFTQLSQKDTADVFERGQSTETQKSCYFSESLSKKVNSSTPIKVQCSCIVS